MEHSVEPINEVSYSRVARLQSTLVHVKDELSCQMFLAILYRLLEINANVIFLAMAMWFIKPVVVFLLFLLLWYIPAVVRTGSKIAPIKQPLRCFFPVDFSLLGLSPRQRSACVSYLISVLRVFLLLALVKVLQEQSFEDKPVLGQMQRILINHKAQDQISNMKDGPWFPGKANTPTVLNESQSLLDDQELEIAELKEHLLTFCILNFSYLFAVLWVGITTVMLCAKVFSREKHHVELMYQELEDKIGAATLLEPGSCHEELEELQEEHPNLKLTLYLNTYIPCVMVLIDVLLDLINIVRFAMERHYFFSFILAAICCISFMYEIRESRAGLLQICCEARLSKERGIWTEDFLTVRQGEKGIEAMPAMVLTIYASAFSTTTAADIFIVYTSIVFSFVGVLIYVFEHCDIGTELYESHADSGLRARIKARLFRSEMYATSRSKDLDSEESDESDEDHKHLCG